MKKRNLNFMKKRNLNNTDMSRQQWIVLMHQLPPSPDSFRVKVWRLLQKSGVISVKNSVYALPTNESSKKALSELAKEIRSGGGEAILMEGMILEGFDIDRAIEDYNKILDGEYRTLSNSLRQLEKKFFSKKQLNQKDLMEIAHLIGKYMSQIEALSKRNHFLAEGEHISKSLLSSLDEKFLARKTTGKAEFEKPKKETYKGRTWVTRAGAKVDRLASAWLIETYIDPQAQFEFVDMDKYKHTPGKLRFDVFDGEFTHEGDLCTFETLLKYFKIRNAKLNTISQIIHDLDLEDDKYQHPATVGIQQLLQGIIMMEKDDFKRKTLAATLFNQLMRSL